MGFCILSSCEKQLQPRAGANDQTYMPGDCFSAPSLQYVCVDYTCLGSSTYEYSYQFKFELQGWKMDYEPLGWIVPWGGATSYRYNPAKEVYKCFGENGKKVKEAFEVQRDEIGRYLRRSEFSLYEVFYDGGIKMRADKDFAGHLAGEDLAPELNDLYFENYESTKLPLGDFVYSRIINGTSFRLNIPKISDGEMLPRGGLEITFTVEMPIKIGMYLTWLNDRIANPVAPYPYREVTLTSTFTVSTDVFN